MEYLKNIPEAVSYLLKEVEILKETVSPSNASIVHKDYDEDTILTAEILKKFKVGDFIKMGGCVFTIITIAASSLKATCLYDLSEGQITIDQLDWEIEATPVITEAKL